MSDLEATQVKPRAGIGTWLFNPFQYLAGASAVTAGLAILLATGLAGSFAHTHMDGVIDIHSGLVTPLWVHLGEGLVDWIAMALPLFIAGRMLAAGTVRAVDVFGTQAIARFPYLIATLLTLLPAYQRQLLVFLDMAERVANGEDRMAVAMSVAGQPLGADMLVFLGIALFNLLMLVWMVALMYRAYAFSCNLKGARAIVSFIIAIVIAEVLSKLGVQALLILARP